MGKDKEIMRKEGFYWVRLKGGAPWRIGHFSSVDDFGSWTLNGSEWIFRDEDFEEIDENKLEKA
jgi:hypothetical protein